ncbi:MAG: hypothetical protein AAF988_05625, partial [Pseudomonadota bacterium]
LIYHHIQPSFDLPSWLKDRGYRIQKAIINRNHKKAAPFMVFSCVEAIKRLLGIHKRFIMTPWQLYQHLEQQNTQNDQKYFYSKFTMKGERDGKLNQTA